MVEGCGDLVVATLLPALYWLHRRWPLGVSSHTLAIHVLGIVPFSLAHTAGMAALRLLWFAGTLGEAHAFPLTWEWLLTRAPRTLLITAC